MLYHNLAFAKDFPEQNSYAEMQNKIVYKTHNSKILKRINYVIVTSIFQNFNQKSFVEQARVKVEIIMEPSIIEGAHLLISILRTNTPHSTTNL